MPDVATALLINSQDELLILKRSNKVSTYKGKWAGISGYVEENEKPYQTAIKEMKEEVGIDEQDVCFIRELGPIPLTDYYNDKRYDWNIFIFLFKTEKKDKIQIDWEHLEYRWVPPSEVEKYDTVPHFKDVVSELLL
jgi:8-oxo-dGTP pyrophosphatase MutT (NUDIX family)